MYFGSVRFFKHVILGMLFLAIIIPTIMTTVLLMENKDLSRRINSYMVQNSQAAFASATLGYNGLKPFQLPRYSAIYPNLRVSCKEIVIRKEPNVAYLTFDDGPSEVTEAILATLKKYNIKATFFVVGNQLYSKENQRRLRRIAEEGHTIGIHTQTHDYEKIYASVDAYLKDFNKVWTKVKKITGIEAEIFRFPGGSLNGYNLNLQHELVAEMLRRGFRYYDWNVSSMDAAVGRSYTVNEIARYSIDVPKEVKAVILMHDSGDKMNTARALPTVIEKLMDKGFSFKALDGSVEPIVFGYQE